MELIDLGLTKELAAQIKDIDPAEFIVGRVTQEHRERYIVHDGINEYDAEITGNLRYSAGSRSGFPAVGDWVLMKTYNSDQAIIHKVLPRKSVLARQAVGKYGEIQIISTNIDTAFILQAINNNFNINRLERYLTICHNSSIEPVIVITKTDLATESEISRALEDLEKRDSKVKYILLSNVTREGIDKITDFIRKGRTYCVVGSSGVGKSTLINNLLGENVLKTSQISRKTNKGRHTTDHRELFILSNGGIIIDTPGMKELGITDNSEGIVTTFHDIANLADRCKFPDCRHISEKGCAVIEALEKGQIDQDSYVNYLRMKKEQERFQTTVADKHRKERIFGKILRNYQKEQKKGEL
jgi:ribosome biogenesis GTPase